MFQYKTEQFLPISVETAWKFFSSPQNLATITPAGLDFKIVTVLKEEEIYEGMKIEYTLKPLFKVPLCWKTEIVNVKKECFFTDRQLKGPYKIWEHTHTFTASKEGVWVQDIVNYQLPLGILGRIAYVLFVKNKIEKIFTYRKNILEKIFKK